MILNLFICFMKTSLNTNCKSQLVIYDNKKTITEQQNCSDSQSFSSDLTVEDNQIAIKSTTVKKDFKRRKKISWKKYLLIDNYQFRDEVREMFNKYVSKKSHHEIIRIKDIDELYTTEEINLRINIYDINEIFIDKTQNKNLIDVVGITLSHKSDDFFNKFDFTNFNEILLSKEFITIFHIVARDMYNVIKNSYDYMYPENEVLKNILLKFEQVTNENIRISTYVSLCKLILNSDILPKYLSEISIFGLITESLHTTHKNNDKIFKIGCAMYHKIDKLIILLKKKKISYCDVLNYIIGLINQFSDVNFRNICIFGLQNLFKKDIKFNMHRSLKIVVCLYIYFYDKKYYSIHWYNFLIKLLSFKVYKCYLPEYTKNCVALFKKDNVYLYYQTYLAMNTENIFLTLPCYDELQNDETQLQLVNALIVITNKVKCKIMGISNMII